MDKYNQARRTEAVVSSSDYQATIGAWLDEIERYAISEMADSQDVSKIYPAQGRYQAVALIKQRISAAFKEIEKHNIAKSKQ